jgi:hypothetical protein
LFYFWFPSVFFLFSFLFSSVLGLPFSQSRRTGLRWWLSQTVERREERGTISEEKSQ